MPVVEKVKKPPSAEDSVTEVPEDIAIEKPKQRKQPTEAMKEAGRQNLAKGRLALQEKRKAAGTAKKPAVVKQENPVPVPVVDVPVDPVPPPHTPARPRSKKILYEEESDSDDEVIIVKKKKKKPAKKIVYEDDSEDEPPVVRKKSIPAVERPASPPRYAQPSAEIRWI